MVTTVEMRETIERYFDGCNEASVEKIASCMTHTAIHYFPPGMYQGPFVGSHTIAERWRDAVATLGSYWTVDNFVGDSDTGVAVIEWTHFKRFREIILRGDEWYEFDSHSGLIKEIRAYYATPQDPSLATHELGGFPYAARGYPLVCPVDSDKSDLGGATQ